jgi:hypothetical protein
VELGSTPRSESSKRGIVKGEAIDRAVEVERGSRDDNGAAPRRWNEEERGCRSEGRGESR